MASLDLNFEIRCSKLAGCMTTGATSGARDAGELRNDERSGAGVDVQLLENGGDRRRYPAHAIVDNSALSAWRESSRVCCRTIGTSERMTLA